MLMDLFSCHGFLKNKDSGVILKCTNGMFEFYLNKGFIIFYCDKNKFRKTSIGDKNRIGAEVTDNSEKVMICSTTIPST